MLWLFSLIFRVENWDLKVFFEYKFDVKTSTPPINLNTLLFGGYLCKELTFLYITILFFQSYFQLTGMSIVPT